MRHSHAVLFSRIYPHGSAFFVGLSEKNKRRKDVKKEKKEYKPSTARQLAVRIATAAFLLIVMIALIVGDTFARRYAVSISNFFGTGEQIQAVDEEVANEAAKTSDGLVRSIADEGIALLRNEDEEGNAVLPLSKENATINLFGWGATDAGILLSGDGSGRSNPHEDLIVTLTQAFTESEVFINQEIINIYERHRTTQDEDWGLSATLINRYSTTLKEPVTSEAFPADVMQRAKEFSDTAVIVLSRYSGEFLGSGTQERQRKYGLPTDETREYNQITTEEQSLIKLCNETFENVIILFNAGSMMDMTFVETGIAPDGEDIGKPEAALNAGYLGQSGAAAVPRLIYGDVTPSAKLADTVVYNPRQNELTRYNEINGSDIVYSEGVYVGYKFYETAAAQGYYDDVTFAGKTGYDAVVEYPFGFGLSYTDFSWEVAEVSLANGSALDKDAEVTVKVRVTNTGDTYSGRDVVQLYFTPPYYKNEVEKPVISLVDFAKTPELAPGESSVVTLSFTAYDLASYDCYDKNANGYATWELDEGNYTFRLMTDAHTPKANVNDNGLASGGELTYRVSKDIAYTTDPVSGADVTNRFTGDTAYLGLPSDGSSLSAGWTYLTRGADTGEDWANSVRTSRYSELSGEDRTAVEAKAIAYGGYDDVYTQMPEFEKDAGAEYKLVVREDGTAASGSDFTSGSVTLKYNDELMFYLADPAHYNDPTDEKWKTFLDQLSKEEIRLIVEDAGYGTKAAYSIGKNVWTDQDGPSGFNTSNFNPSNDSKLTAFPTENMVGQTWSKDLLFRMGQVIGVDANNFNMSGIYAPGVNIHKNSFGARNYEYYSEDAVLSGLYAAQFSLGAKSNGAGVYVKHFVNYDYQTTGRVWETEQALREIYLKPFEIAIKEGGATGVMSSFNRFGPQWTGGNHALINDILRGEWGFNGVVITDYTDGTNDIMKMDQSLRARSGLQLNPLVNQAEANGRIDLNDPVDVNLARLTVKDVVYAKCNVYYAAKNNTIQNEFTVTVSGPRATKYGFDWWIMLLVFINIIVFGLLVWRALALALPLIKDIRMRRAAKAGAGSDEAAYAVADFAVSGADETPYAAYGASETAAAGEEQPEPQPEEAEKAEAEESEAETPEAEEAGAEIPAPAAVVIPAPAAAPSDPTVRAEMDAMHEQIAELTRKVDALTAALAAKKPTAAQRNAEKRKELSDQMKNMDDKLSAINEMLSAMTRDRGGADGSGAPDRKKK